MSHLWADVVLHPFNDDTTTAALHKILSSIKENSPKMDVLPYEYLLNTKWNENYVHLASHDSWVKVWVPSTRADLEKMLKEQNAKWPVEEPKVRNCEASASASASVSLSPPPISNTTPSPRRSPQEFRAARSNVLSELSILKDKTAKERVLLYQKSIGDLQGFLEAKVRSHKNPSTPT